MFYGVSDGLSYEFETRWNHRKDPNSGRKEFPTGSEGPPDIVTVYHTFEEFMNTKYHEKANLGAAVSNDGLLTDHGVKHVKSVIAHAKDILSDVNQLTGYEIYLLLCAIHFHDVGNILGREDHEKKIDDIIVKEGDRLPFNQSEIEYITRIAKAHGGYADSTTKDKDTIRDIKTDFPDKKYDSIPIRLPALAAILRFADEISDDFTRTDYDGIPIPTENEVYHEYSKALEPISIGDKGDKLIYTFRIPYELTQKKIGKGSKSVYLYSEILARLAKCMRELEYCRKYADGLIKINTVSVNITVTQKNNSNKTINDLKQSFMLTLNGYPDAKIYKLSHYLANPSGTSGYTSLKYTSATALLKAAKAATV